MEQILQQLIDFVREASPALWQILVKQVYAESISNAIWMIVLSVVSFALYKCFKFTWKGMEDNSGDEWIWGVIFSAAGLAFSTLVALITLTGLIKMLYNPEFYAIKYIVEQIK